MTSGYLFGGFTFLVILRHFLNIQVCTFQLIVNNASSLLDDKDPIKLEAESKLTDVIR